MADDGITIRFFNAADTCNGNFDQNATEFASDYTDPIYDRTFWLGFSITLCNSLGFYLMGTGLPYKWLWKHRPLKKIAIGLMAVLIWQPFSMFIWTLIFEGMYNDDAFAVSVISATPSWAMPIFFMRYWGNKNNNTPLAQIVVWLATFLAVGTMDLNIRIYGSWSMGNEIYDPYNDNGGTFYVPWAGIVNIWCLYNCYIIGGLATQIMYPKESLKYGEVIYEAARYLGGFISLAVPITYKGCRDKLLCTLLCNTT